MMDDFNNQYSQVNQYEMNNEASFDDDEDAAVREQLTRGIVVTDTQILESSHLPFYTKHQPCTDFPFLFLFLCFLLVLCVMYGSTHSTHWSAQPKTLLYPTDFLGRSCGSQNKQQYSLTKKSESLESVNTLSIPYVNACKKSVYSKQCQEQVFALFSKFTNKNEFYDLRDKPYLYYLNTEEPAKYGGVCVSYCPGIKEDADYCPPELEEHSVNGTHTGRCSYTRMDGEKFTEATDKLQFRTVLNRCIPTTASLKAAHFAPAADVLDRYASMLPEVFSESVAHVVRQWKVVLLSLVISLLLAFVFLVVIRLFARFFIWFIFTTVFIGLVIGLVLSTAEATQWRQRYLPVTPRTENFYYYSSKLSSQTYGIIAIFTGMSLFMYSVFIYVYYKDIQRSVGIMRESARAVSSIPQLLLFCLGMFLSLLLFYMYWFLMSVNLWSVGTASVVEENTVFVFSRFMRAASTIHLFAFFWLSQFISAYSVTTIANVICQWYFTPKAKRPILFLTMPVLRAALTVLLYNMGSVAFGSLVVGIVKFISFVLKRAVNKFEKALNKQNVVVTTVVGCFACIIRVMIAFINKIVNTISKHAFIQIGIYGTGFLESSFNAITLLKNNTAQILVLDWIVDWIVFCGKICVAVVTCYCAYWLSLVIPSSTGKIEPTTNFSLVLLALVFLTSYRIASLFLSVYETATDTIIHCYLIDEQLSNTNPSRPMCCSSELLGLMEYERTLNEEVLKMNAEE
jgi:choline transporter-like protein 2/4/5